MNGGIGMYCEKCSLLFDGDRCPECGGRRIREAKEDDICFLTEKGQFETDMLAEVLEQNHIPFLKKGRRGAALTMMAGAMLESFRIYVACRDHDAARAFVQELFESSPDSDDDTAGEEYGEEDDGTASDRT